MSADRLKRQLEIERVIASIANQFIMFEDISSAISLALERIGIASHSSRAYIFELDTERETMSNTYEWCSEGVVPEIENLQQLPISLFPWWIERISSGNVLNIHDVEKLGPEAEAEKEILQAQGIRSVLVLPIHFKGNLHGFVGFDDCKNVSQWKEQDEILLGLAADIFSNAFDRKNIDDELRRTNEQLTVALDQVRSIQTQLIQQEQMAAIGQLAAGVAHEINNPLGFIISNQSMLREYTYDTLKLAKASTVLADREKQRLVYIENDLLDMMEDIDDGLNRIKKIVAGLKSFSRVDGNVDMDNFNLAEGLEHTLTILQNRIKYKVDLDLIIPENLPIIECDGSKMNQVMLNLITNSLDAIDENESIDQGLIKISMDVKDQYIHFEIKDNGIGIKDEVKNKIYQPFFTTKPVGKGTGYGLSIVYDTIVSVHHGFIGFNSEYGKGTCFTFEIPIKQSEAE